MKNNSQFHEKLHTFPVRDPLFIFSKPTARTQSAIPPATNCSASIKAEEPVEQLLLTL